MTDQTRLLEIANATLRAQFLALTQIEGARDWDQIDEALDQLRRDREEIRERFR